MAWWLQVLGKRRKVVADMCDQLAVKARQVAQSGEWDAFRGDEDDARDGVPAAVDAFLKERLSSLAEEEAEHYNNNAPLGEAIQEAVAISDILDGWPQELRSLSQAVGAESEKALVLSEDALVLPKGEVNQQVAEGICALMWARPALDLDLNGRKMAPACLGVLCRALRASVASLSLSETDFAKAGNDLSGMRHLCAALRDVRRCGGLRTLKLAKNNLKADAALLLGKALMQNTTLTLLECSRAQSNHICASSHAPNSCPGLVLVPVLCLTRSAMCMNSC